MITKERLEELIKEKAKVYFIYNESFIAGYSSIAKIKELDLSDFKPIYFTSSNIENDFVAIKSTGLTVDRNDFENLFETEEDARWELEMTVTRTETLKLPKWEDAQNEKFSFTYLIDVKGLHLYINIYKFTNKFNISCHHGCHFGDYSYEKTFNLRDKKQYKTACKLCLRLFKGEEV